MLRTYADAKRSSVALAGKFRAGVAGAGSLRNDPLPQPITGARRFPQRRCEPRATWTGAGSQAGAAVYFGDGAGGFGLQVSVSAAMETPLAADLDGDGTIGLRLRAANRFNDGQTELLKSIGARKYTAARFSKQFAPTFPLTCWVHQFASVGERCVRNSKPRGRDPHCAGERSDGHVLRSEHGDSDHLTRWVAMAPLFIRNGIAGTYPVSAVVSGYPSGSTSIAFTN